ncbi:MAG: hypothetical protein D3916_10100 [Candidatus Electrothrix sp. MAN1_4]|nr:hypothetical protein [Candidatus Electrothrix sp. MAN1_4]
MCYFEVESGPQAGGNASNKIDMNRTEITCDHTNRLRLKDSAEAALAHYKNIHPFLSETDSHYLKKLKQELQGLEKSYIGDRDQRKFSRIKIQRAAYLDFSSAQYHIFLEKISMSGFFVRGIFKELKDDICIIDIKKSDIHSDSAVRAVGSIVRVDDSGIALEFLAMKPKSYLGLKAALLAHAPDPSVLNDEISSRNFFIFSDDLVCNTIFNSKRDEIKKVLNLF